MKKIFTFIICILTVSAQLLSMLSCTATTADKTPDETVNDTAEDTKDPVPTKPESSKNPDDYEIPKGLTDAFSIVCVSYSTLGKTHFLEAFLSKDGNYYLVVPDAVDLSNVALYFHSQNGSAKHKGKLLNSRISFFDFSKNDSIEITVDDKINKVSETKTLIVQQSVVPVVYLDVDESLGTIYAMQDDKSKNTHAYGVMYLDSADDTLDLVSHFDIHGHGNSTWKGDHSQKQPYNIKFTDDDTYDSGRKVSPLGMRANSKWCLLADASERSYLRTRVAHYLGAQVEMDYALQSRYTNVYMGSDFIGSYYLIEKTASVEEALDLELATGDNMDGSWIMEFDNASGQANQFTVKGVKVTVKSPIDGCDYSALKAYLNEVSVALNDPKGLNKATGKYYYDYIDLESYAKFLLVREFSMDYDLVVDHWAYYDAKEGKMNAGPLWDFNNSMWTCGGARGHLSMYKDTDKLLVMQDDKGPGCWLQCLMKFEKFTDLLKAEYEKYSYLFELDDPRCIFTVYEGWYDEVKPLAEQNSLRWNTLKETEPIKGFEYDNSAYSRYYAYVAKFLYCRCRDYGTALSTYAVGKQ